MSADQVPVLHVRGSNYEIGFSIGRTFSNLIRDFVEGCADLRDILIPAYESEEGRQIYETCLKTCTTRFPQYVKELEGISQGSGISFFKLFLLHIDTLIIQNEEAKIKSNAESDNSGSKGCTNILCNHDDLILGHTEDALAEMSNNFFIVCAQVLGDGGEILEDFSSIVYPGYLPGYTMGYNSYGILHAINTIRPSRTFPEKTPVMFITRALLSARSSADCIKIVKDSGCGISDGFSFDLVSLQENQNSAPVVWNVEVGPSLNSEEKESAISLLDVKPGQSFVHCNKYLRLEIPHNSGFSSDHRHAAIASAPPPNDLTSLKNALSDRSNREFPVFRSPSKTEPQVATICVGIFDAKKKSWSIYTKPPNSSQPVAVLPLKLNC